MPRASDVHPSELIALVRRILQTSEIEESLARLAHIARQTLGFYCELRAPSRINLSESVVDILAFYKKRFADNEISVQTELSDETEIRGIPGKIREVISNLLTNAIEALEPGGRVRMQSRRPRTASR